MGNSSVEAIAVRNTIWPKRRAARKRGKKNRLDFGRLPFQHRQLPISHIKTVTEKNSVPGQPERHRFGLPTSNGAPFGRLACKPTTP